ncbi:ABC transporter permease [Chitiniphilus purpureus]|uniref:ABC transporter permease n=1 Tax=Chitiniphilus purpureus TaxID=2981137 RepID=A0ABY6DSK1_9NEIS|nr:ABC transporter permease [Chitiniphilus sp. CD1]UXY16056.1 ABC transporter permease [Chitiniphilus sp. CD1]
MSSLSTTLGSLPLPASPAGAPWLARLARHAGFAALGAVLPLTLFALWQYAVDRQWLAEQILPPPALVWQSLVELWDSGELVEHLTISLARVAWSFAIGGSAGLVLGAALGLSRSARAYVYPSFSVVAQFPVVGWIPLLIIFLGIDEALKVAAIAIAVVVPVTVNTYQGITNIPRAWVEVGRVYGFSLPQTLARVVLPAAAPGLFTGLRQGVMQAWLTLVFVELLASSEGIGYLMVWGRQLLQLDLVVVAMIAIGAVGLALELSLRFIESRVLGWRRSAF